MPARAPVWILVFCILFLAVSLSAGEGAFAEDPPADAPPAPALPKREIVDEMVVTATKRAQSIQDVPISMESLDANLIDDAGLTNFANIQQFVPNLSINPVTDSRSTVIRIRGIGSVGNNAGIDPSVGVFIDGIYQGRAGMSTSDLLDVERIEVLRGPQGTLYGKNTAAGAIRIISKRPTYEYEALAEGVFGKFNQREGRFSLNLPLVEDQVATRISGYVVTRDGFDDNRYTDDPAKKDGGGKLNDANKMGIKGRTLFDVADDFSFLITGDFSYEHTQCCVADVLTYKGRPTLAPGVTFPDLAASTGRPLPNAAGFDRNLYVNNTPRNNVQIGGVAVDADYDLFDTPLIKDIPFLSDASVKLLGSWRHYKSDSQFDGDFSAYNAVFATNDVKLDQYSFEMNLQSPGGELIDYTAGFFFYHQKMQTVDTNSLQDEFYPIFPILTFTGPPPLVNTGDNTHKTWSYAGFSEVTINPHELVSLVGGVRVTYEKKTRVGSQISTTLLPIDAPPLLGPDIFQDQKRDVTNVSGTAKLQIFPTDDIMLYASFANGFKSGGFNQLRTVAGVPGEFDDEEVRSYEGGFKTTWFDKRVILNATGYYMDYDDFQSQTFNGASINVRNAGDLDIYGVEADLTVFPIEGLTLNGALGYNHAEYDSFENGPTTAKQQWRRTGGDPQACGGLTPPPPGVRCNQDLSGKRKDNAPRWSANAGGQYEWPTPWYDTELFARIDYSYVSSRFLEPDLDPEVKQKATHNVNLRAGIRDIERHWELIGWVQNLTKEEYLVAAFDIPTLGGFAGVNAPRRTFGLTARVGF